MYKIVTILISFSNYNIKCTLLSSVNFHSQSNAALEQLSGTCAVQCEY